MAPSFTPFLEEVLSSLEKGAEPLLLSKERLDRAFRSTRTKRGGGLSTPEGRELAALGYYLHQQEAHAASAVVFAFLRAHHVQPAKRR